MVALRAARKECRKLNVHTHSVPQFRRLFFIPCPLQGLSATLSARSLPQLRLCQFFDVVHYAIKVPLGVDLNALSGVGCETNVGHFEGLVLRVKSGCETVDVSVSSYVIYSG